MDALEESTDDTTIYAGINKEVICKVGEGDPEFTSISIESLRNQIPLYLRRRFPHGGSKPNKNTYIAGGSTGGAHGLELLGQAIGDSTEITSLSLNNEGGALVEEFDLMPFVTGLRNNRSIRDINFHLFGGDILGSLGTIYPNLTRINFYGCELGEEVLALLSSAVGLTSLSICNRTPSGTFAHNDELLEGVIDALNDGIESIYITGQNMGARSWKALVKILPKLQSLSLDHCNNGGMGDLIAVLPVSSFLRSLSIWNTFIGTDDVEMLARVLNSNSTLEVLKLRSCNIQNEAVIALAGALANNFTLKTLDLDDDFFFDFAENVISVEGWSALSKALCDTSSANNTYFSNHTLEDVRPRRDLPSDVKSYLEMNKCTNKEQVAIKKVVSIHRHCNIGVGCDQYDFSLPQEIWANVLHYLPYESLISFATASRAMLNDVLPLVSMLHIEEPSQLQLGLVTKHLRDVRSVSFYKLFRKNRMESCLKFDQRRAANKVVHFLCRFEDLEAVHFWGEIGTGMSRYCSLNSLGNTDISPGHEGGMNNLIESISGAFDFGALSNSVSILGLSCPKRLTPTRAPGECNVCKSVCKYFPLWHIGDVDLCLPDASCWELIKSREGGENYLRSENRFLQLLGKGRIYRVIYNDGRIYSFIGYDAALRDAMGRFVEQRLLDVTKLNQEVIFNAITKQHRNKNATYLDEQSFDFLKTTLGVPICNSLLDPEVCKLEN